MVQFSMNNSAQCVCECVAFFPWQLLIQSSSHLRGVLLRAKRCHPSGDKGPAVVISEDMPFSSLVEEG